MKIIRFIDEEGKTRYGEVSPDCPDQARILQTDMTSGDRLLTNQVSKIKKLLAPIVPVNILALGINYKKHGDETAMSYPDQPILFLKSTSSLTDPESPILLPTAGPDCVDYEAELAVVIGRQAKNVSPAEAMDYVLGYTCANDVSARDWQFDKQKGQWARGKSFDTFCPLGPCLVTRHDIVDPGRLSIRAILNGKIVQEANTSDMIFDISSIISHLSRSMTLLPGTVILTGTPEGVGFTRKPPLFLKEGDTITVEIEGVGSLTNPVRKERSSDFCPTDSPVSA
jgi:2-keto-4-pentenoate hydratase/2-oxohepta-3-ene-1,7-dioic acid hydratase in catechol pathway